jgi:hypothetical protein
LAVNKLGQHFLDKGGRQQAKVYGWERSVWLAQKKPELALQSPENYAIFAGMMFWSDWWWIRGVAETAAQIAA